MKKIKLLTSAFIALSLSACGSSNSGGGSENSAVTWLRNPTVSDTNTTFNENLASVAGSSSISSNSNQLIHGLFGASRNAFDITNLASTNDVFAFDIAGQAVSGGTALPDAFSFSYADADHRERNQTTHASGVVTEEQFFIVEQVANDIGEDETDLYIGIKGQAYATTAGAWVAGGIWNLAATDFTNDTIRHDEFFSADMAAFVTGSTLNTSLPATGQVEYRGSNVINDSTTSGFGSDHEDAVIMVEFGGNNSTKMLQAGTSFFGDEIELTGDINWSSGSFSGTNMLVCATGASVCGTVTSSAIEAKFYGGNEINDAASAPDFLGGVLGATITEKGAGAGDPATSAIGSFVTVEQVPQQ